MLWFTPMCLITLCNTSDDFGIVLVTNFWIYMSRIYVQPPFKITPYCQGFCKAYVAVCGQTQLLTLKMFLKWKLSHSASKEFICVVILSSRTEKNSPSLFQPTRVSKTPYFLGLGSFYLTWATSYRCYKK